VARFVVEADGGSRGNPGPAAYGSVVRDADTGEVLAERAEFIGTASNNVAEYRGLIAGLLAVRDIDADATVEARLDSKLVVEQMSGRWQIKHPAMRPLALEARRVFPPGRVTYVWVPRERNTHADRLANEALDAAARGETWSPSASTAELRAVEDRARAGLAPVDVEPSDVGPPNALVGWDTDLGTPTTTLLLRHGQTPHTVDKRFSGRGGHDPSLNADGRAQVRAAGRARWLDQAWLKFGLFPLLPAAVAFRLHQVITFGGFFGEAYTFGLGAWLLGLGVWWASWALGLMRRFLRRIAGKGTRWRLM